MGVIQRVVKPKTHRGKRELEKREAKLVENTKQSIFFRANKSSDLVLRCLKDLVKLKKPNAVFFSRKNEFRPFEAANEIEGFCKKQDASLFGFASHNKKRPNNLVLGRTFDHQILDMVEFGVDNFKSLEEFKNAKVATGCKPCLIFSGEAFLSPSSDFFRIKNLFVDFFHGEEIVNIRVEGLEHVLSFVAHENKIFIRSYRTILMKSGEKTPYVELEEIGPSIDLTFRRSKLASADLFKSACKKPKEVKVKKVKNISKDPFGSKLGRVHMPKQDLRRLPTRNMKGLRKTAAEQKLERAKKAEERKNDPNRSTRASRRAAKMNGGPMPRRSDLSGANTTPLPALPVSVPPSAKSKSMTLHLSA